MNANETNVNEIKAIIRERIERISKGKVFDAHTIIVLLRSYPDSKELVDEFQDETQTKTVHSQLSKYIKQLESEGLIEEYIPNYEQAYPCKYWIRL